MSVLHKMPVLLLFLSVSACDKPTPVELRDSANTFNLRANWSASAAPVGTATVSGALSLKQYDGFRMTATMNLTGTPNATYQWRIFRGDCTVNVAAATNVAPTGLVLFATAQSYGDVVLNASGTGSISATIAGSLDSLKSYSLRVRVFQATTWNGTSPLACGNLQRSPA